MNWFSLALWFIIAALRFSKEAKKVLKCQSSCFDCSIFSEFVLGPSCNEYGTPGYETCKERGQCKCVTCCRFEFLRTYHPDRLRGGMGEAIRALPTPHSEPARAFQDGRATIEDINGFLKHKHNDLKKERKNDNIQIGVQT